MTICPDIDISEFPLFAPVKTFTTRKGQVVRGWNDILNLGATSRILERAIEKGELRGFKSGRKCVHRADIIHWMNARSNIPYRLKPMKRTMQGVAL